MKPKNKIEINDKRNNLDLSNSLNNKYMEKSKVNFINEEKYSIDIIY